MTGVVQEAIRRAKRCVWEDSVCPLQQRVWDLEFRLGELEHENSQLRERLRVEGIQLEEPSLLQIQTGGILGL